LCRDQFSDSTKQNTNTISTTLLQFVLSTIDEWPKNSRQKLSAD